MKKIMSEKEYMDVIRAAVRPGPKTEEQLMAIINWAEETRVNQMLLDGLLAGYTNIEFDGVRHKKKDMLFTRGPFLPRKTRNREPR